MSHTPTRTYEQPDGLHIDTYYLECLAQGSYLVYHEDNAFVIDPRRDIDIYVDAIEQKKLKLKGVLESHLHADFVSGHMELHKRLGTTIFIGENAGAQFPHYPTTDGEEFVLSSKYKFRSLATPGHTFGCVTWLLMDRTNDKAIAAFTGDTLFVGGVGRPDLVGAIIPGATPEKLSENMFASLKKLMALPDDCLVYPAHGPGSPCGKGISADLSSTIGKEKTTNPALQIADEAEFIQFNISGLGKAPQYFPNAVMTNLKGAEDLNLELSKVAQLNIKEFDDLVSQEHPVVLDTRGAIKYSEGHIPDSINIPLGEFGGVTLSEEDGNFAIWVGTLISPHSKVIIVSAEGKEQESVERLSRIGYGSNVLGVLKKGFEAWKATGRDVDTYSRLPISSAADIQDLRSKGYVFVDVRTPGEYGCVRRGHLNEAINLPLQDLETAGEELVKDKKYAVYCVSGFRSTIGTSILRHMNLDAVDLIGGYNNVLKVAKEETNAKI